MSEDPTTPLPDDKDWTWVLEQACPDCGYDPRSVDPVELPRLVGEATAGWPARLAAPDARERPEPAIWSPLEYACHVRDVLRIFAQRVTLMLDEDNPRFANWDQDETAVAERYWAQDPGVVAGELAAAADQAAKAFARPSGAQWDRPGVRSNGSVFTVASLGIYFLHDIVHHVWDVRQA